MIKNSTTKKVNLSREFTTKAKDKPTEALAFMFINAFGFNVSMAIEVASRIVKNKDEKAFALCVAAGLQVRGNVAWVDPAGMKDVYPELFMNSDREVQDMLNMKAAHMVGHVFYAWSGSALAQSASKKAGNCVTGMFLNETVGGKINAEIFNAMSKEDKVMATATGSVLKADDKVYIDGLFDSMKTKAATFMRKD